MAKRLIQLATFCNTYTHYSPNKDELVVRRETSNGGHISTKRYPLSEAEFGALRDKVEAGYNYDNAIMFSANAAERLLIEVEGEHEEMCA
jgi:hypothetical protein